MNVSRSSRGNGSSWPVADAQYRRILHANAILQRIKAVEVCGIKTRQANSKDRRRTPENPKGDLSGRLFPCSPSTGKSEAPDKSNMVFPFTKAKNKRGHAPRGGCAPSGNRQSNVQTFSTALTTSTGIFLRTPSRTVSSSTRAAMQQLWKENVSSRSCTSKQWLRPMRLSYT